MFVRCVRSQTSNYLTWHRVFQVNDTGRRQRASVGGCDKRQQLRGRHVLKGLFGHFDLQQTLTTEHFRSLGLFKAKKKKG